MLDHQGKKQLNRSRSPAGLIILFGALVAAAVVWGRHLPERSFLGDDYIYLYYAENTPHWSAGDFSHWGPRNHLRPVTWFTVYLEYRFFGLNAPAHHAVHLALHLLNGLLFGLVLARIFPERIETAAIAAGLFLLHPIHADSLGWASGAVDIIAGFWILSNLALYLWMRSAGSRLAQLLWLATLPLALYAKETGFALMLLIPLLDLFRSSDLWRRKIKAHGRWWLKAWAIGGLYLLSRVLVLGGLFGTSDPASPSGQLLGNPARLFQTVIPPMLHYLALPVPDAIAALLPGWMIGLMLLWLGTWLGWGLLRAKAGLPLLLGLLWMIATVLPALPAFGIGPHLEQGRYLYLPALGFCLLIASPLSFKTSGTFIPTFRSLPLIFLLAAEIWGSASNLKPWQESWQVVSRLVRQVQELRPRWNQGDLLIVNDLPRQRRGAQLLGDDQTLTVAMSMALFPLEARRATRHQAQGLRIPLEARAGGFVGPAEEIPPPAWNSARLGKDCFVYQYQPEGLSDLTPRLRDRLQEREELAAVSPVLPALELYRLGSADLLTLHDLELLSSGVFQVRGPLPYLIFPRTQITALLVDKLEIDLQAPGMAPADPDRVWAVVYWSAEASPRFSEERRATFPLILDRKPHRYQIDLGNRPRWLWETSVQWFRLDVSPGLYQPVLFQVRILPHSTGAPSPP